MRLAEWTLTHYPQAKALTPQDPHCLGVNISMLGALEESWPSGSVTMGFSPRESLGQKMRAFLHIWAAICGKRKQRPADLLEISGNRQPQAHSSRPLAAGAAVGFGAGTEIFKEEAAAARLWSR